MNIIETNNLCKQFGKTIRVKNLNLSVEEGTIYGFLGPNGAGKSTTLKMILGLIKPTAGNISVFEKPVNSNNRLEILKDIGSLIESPSYYGHLTGYENLKIVQALRNVPAENITNALKIVRLENQKDKRVCHYSLGMKQRLGIAAAILANPKLLILDEPTNGLDPAGIQEIRELIISLPTKFGMTVIVSSHLLSEVDQIATTVGIINNGELIFQNSLEILHKHSKENIAIRTLNNSIAIKILENREIPFKTQEDFILLPLLKDETVFKLNQALLQNHIEVVRIEERKKSLEDIFLELTGTEGSL